MKFGANQTPGPDTPGPRKVPPISPTPLTPKGFHLYRGSEKWLVRGITYGPFRPDARGEPYPDTAGLHADFSAMQEAGANTIRLYTPPIDDRLARVAAEHGLQLMLDVPWPKHIDVYDQASLRGMCHDMVEDCLGRAAQWPNVAGVLLGNEIPADLVRWEGPRRVQDFLHGLYRQAKNLCPDVAVGFANYPSTEFLQPRFFDFLGFNIYLHDPDDFRRYLVRLRHMYPETPLVLTEVGFDVQTQGEDAQQQMLTENLRQAYDVGFAGAIVFNWTDEWHAGGYDMTDWSFGLTDEGRVPRPALATVSEVFRTAPQCHERDRWPKVSVVVATYNGARTLEQCLESLGSLRYANYEVIVVDDGSTDETPEILARHPEVRVHRQENRGLSAARNAGIDAATGDIVAFTDSDCFVDPDWLYHIVTTMETAGVSGVGGPNLTPHQNALVDRCIALAPGHATHVMLTENEAEHVPGCNMSFRREALVEAGGFDPIFRAAGDDVDIIWRLQDLGHEVAFSPGGFVWHHRRPTLGAYWKQQIGYGRAEALLLGKHPHRFNERGQSIWRGRIYGPQEASPLAAPHIHYGVFGSAGYQCIYEQTPRSIFYWLVSPEFWLLCLVLLAAGMFAFPALLLGLLGAGASLSVSAIQAWRRRMETRRLPLRSFPVLWWLFVSQPIVRGLARYWGRLRFVRPSAEFRDPQRRPMRKRRPGLWPTDVLEYWAEQGCDRLDILRAIARRMASRGWFFVPDSGWQPWDLSVVVTWWFKVRVTSAQEDHGADKRLLRLRFRLVPTSLCGLLVAAGLAVSAILMLYAFWLRLIIVALLVFGWFAYRRGQAGKEIVEALSDSVVSEMGYLALSDDRVSADALDPEAESLEIGPNDQGENAYEIGG